MLEIPMFFFIFLFPIFTLSFHLSQRCNPVVFIYLFISFTLIHLFPSWRGWCYSPHYIERTNLITMIDFYEKLSSETPNTLFSILPYIRLRTYTYICTNVYDVKSYYLKSNNLNTEVQPAIVPKKGSKDSVADGEPDGFYVICICGT